MFECLDIDAGVDAGRAAEALEDIQGLLALWKKHFDSVVDRALPAHIIAALKPIAEKARQLADLIHPHQLRHEITREVPALRDGVAWRLLTDIDLEAQLAIERLRAQPSVGEHVSIAGEAMRAIDEQLEQLFTVIRGKDTNSSDIAEYSAARAEFVRVCRKYVGAPPTRRTPRGAQKVAEKQRIAKGGPQLPVFRKRPKL